MKGFNGNFITLHTFYKKIQYYYTIYWNLLNSFQFKDPVDSQLNAA